jgi:hypothetical protein
VALFVRPGGGGVRQTKGNKGVIAKIVSGKGLWSGFQLNAGLADPGGEMRLIPGVAGKHVSGAKAHFNPWRFCRD